jgi:hypothetical protein
MLWETMTEQCGLQHVRGVSVLSRTKRYEWMEYVDEVEEFVGEIDDGLMKEFKGPEKGQKELLTACVGLKDKLLVTEKAHNLFYVPPSTFYDPTSMHASIFILPDESSKYRIVLMVWPGHEPD